MRSWWLRELEHAGHEHLDADFVAGFDAKQQFDAAPDIDVLTALGLGPGRTVIDLGAGTGTFTLAAAATGANVIAVDVSPAMVDVLEQRTSGLANVIVSQAGFLSYEHVGEPVGYVYCRNALHQLPDFWKVIALRRIDGWLAPGGILRLRDLVYDFLPDQAEKTIDAWLDGASADPTRGYTADDYGEHVRSEFSTFTWLLEPMLAATGFDIVSRETERDLYAAYTCRTMDTRTISSGQV